MQSKLVAKFMAFTVLFTSVCFSKIDAYSMTATAKPTNQKVLINSATPSQSISSYNINGYNYFQLRDLAKLLSDNDKNVDVGYDTITKTATITTNSPYKGVFTKDNSGYYNAVAYPSNTNISFNGQLINIKAYLINSKNYFQLRDFLKLVNCGVIYNPQDNSLDIKPDISYNDGLDLENSNNHKQNNTPIQPPKQPQNPPKKETVVDTSKYTDEVLRLVNIEREKAGATPLQKGDYQDYVDLRAKELNELFSHTRPNGKSALDYEVSGYFLNGENIAWGQRTPEEVMNSWMNSPGHKSNILNPSTQYLCVGYDNNRWVQVFAISYGKPPQNAQTKKQPQNTQNQQNQDTNKKLTTPPQKQEAVDTSNYTQEVVKLVNQEREKRGLSPLSTGGYQDYANLRAKEITNVFSHTRPGGENALNYLMNLNGVYTAAENIATAQTPEDVMNIWMNSPGHKSNILNKNLTHLCVGYADGCWVQVFVGK